MAAKPKLGDLVVIRLIKEFLDTRTDFPNVTAKVDFDEDSRMLKFVSGLSQRMSIMDFIDGGHADEVMNEFRVPRETKGTYLESCKKSGKVFHKILFADGKSGWIHRHYVDFVS